MDHALRCNSLKCRAQLTDRAVVTTCSHIFCIPCSDSLGLAHPAGERRICPACATDLVNPDDAVSTQLNPSEDYKTSVLSGLSPTAIMECAGRGLAFWSYQSTQEIVYQEYQVKVLTNKFGNLGNQMDKIINDANSEIDNLNQKLGQMQMEQDKLRSDHTTLINAFREKTRQHKQAIELYDKMKRKEMTAATQEAAFEAVDTVLRSNNGRSGTLLGMVSGLPDQSGQSSFGRTFGDNSNADNFQAHHREHSNGSGSNGRMMPPPLSRPNPTFGGQQFRHQPEAATPSHRTPLGPLNGNHSSIRNPASLNHVSSYGQTPAQRRPATHDMGNTSSRSSISGYGMSAAQGSNRFSQSLDGQTSGGLRFSPQKAFSHTNAYF